MQQFTLIDQQPSINILVILKYSASIRFLILYRYYIPYCFILDIEKTCVFEIDNLALQLFCSTI